MGLCNRYEERVCTEERDTYWWTVKKGEYQTLKATSNSTCIFVRKKNSKKQIV